jgi:hypothetical protein
LSNNNNMPKQKSVKKGTRKSSGRKSTGRKSTGRKSTGRKSTGRKSTGRKSTGRKSTGRKSARKVITRKIRTATKYKTGESSEFEGSCNAEKVRECVNEGKYCNVDTGKCIQPKTVKTKVNKDKTLAVDNKYGVVGKATAVQNIKKYLETLSKTKQKELDIGITSVITEKKPRKRITTTKALSALKKKPSAKLAKKTCTQEDCATEGKLCSTTTGNCIKDTPANRKKLGLKPAKEKKPARKVAKKVEKPAKKVVKKAEKPAKKIVDYSTWTVKQLKDELRKRGLAIGGVKDDLIKRLKTPPKVVAKVTGFEAMTVKQLKDELRKLKLPVSGTKSELIKKLQTIGKAETPEEEEEISEEEETPEEEKVEEETPEEEEVEEETPEEEEVEEETPEEEEVEEETPEEEEEEEETPEEEEVEEETPEVEKGCTTKGCDVGEVCNAETDECIEQDKVKVKNLHILSFNGGVYQGSKQTLSNFAKKMGINNPEIKPATRVLIKKLLSKKVKKPSPEEEEELDITGMIGEEPEEEEKVVEEPEEDVTITGLEAEEPEEEGGPEKMAQILHDISAEKPLSKEQKNMVDKIRKCIGI